MNINYSFKNIVILLALIVANAVFWEILSHMPPLKAVGYVATCLSCMFLAEAFLSEPERKRIDKGKRR